MSDFDFDKLVEQAQEDMYKVVQLPVKSQANKINDLRKHIEPILTYVVDVVRSQGVTQYLVKNRLTYTVHSSAPSLEEARRLAMDLNRSVIKLNNSTK